MTRLRKFTIFLILVIILLGLLSILKLQEEMTARAVNASKTASISSVSVTNSTPLFETQQPTGISPTSTFTLTPETPKCVAKVVGGERTLWQLPTRGVKEGGISLPNGAQVSIENHLSDYGWLPVHFGSQYGWLRSDFITFDQSCLTGLPHSDLVPLLQSVPIGYEALYEDTFYDDRGTWLDLENRKITSRISDEFGDYYLSISAGTKELRGARLNAPELQQIENFELQMSISPVIGSITEASGYFAIRFHVSEDRRSYYELRLLRRCQIQLFRVESYEYTLINDTKLNFPSLESSCNDGTEEYIRLSITDNVITGQINDLRLPIIQNSDPSGVLSTGSIELLSSESTFRIYFLMILKPE